MYNFRWLLLLFTILYCQTTARAQKKVLAVSDFDTWKGIPQTRLSHPGNWFAYQVKAYKGDPSLILKQLNGEKEYTFARGVDPAFSPSESYLAYRIKPSKDTIRSLQWKKVKPDKFPKDSLGVWVIGLEIPYVFPKLMSYKLPKEQGEWMALLKHPKVTKKGKKKPWWKRREKRKKPGKIFKEAPKTGDLIILNPNTGNRFVHHKVSNYTLSEDGQFIAFSTQIKENKLATAVYVFNTKTEVTKRVFVEPGIVRRLSLSTKSNYLAFIHSPDTKKIKHYSLYCSAVGDIPAKVVGAKQVEFPKGWSLSDKGAVYFSKNESKLYFGTAPTPKKAVKDSLLSSEKVRVDVWHWKDERIQPEQLKGLKRDRDRTYLAVYFTESKTIQQLNTDFNSRVICYNYGNKNYGLLIDKAPYLKQKSWDISKRGDYYYLNFITGERTLLDTALTSSTSLSNMGKYFAYFSHTKKKWQIKNTETGELKMVDLPYSVIDTEHDYPSLPAIYRPIGWTKDDKAFWLRDRYDVWAVDPTAKAPPVSITNDHGRKNKLRFSCIKLDRKIQHVDPNNTLFHSFNEETKNEAFHNFKNGEIEILLSGTAKFSRVMASANGKTLVWTKQNATTYPDYWWADRNFKSPKQITNANPQQKDYNWTSVELFKWQVDENTQEEGLLYKPENFDPQKKYPVLIYFYRLSSQGLHSYISPKQSRSIINPTFFASQGYLVFVPNIRYEIGHPGNSAVKYVTSGAKALQQLPYVDADHIGIQGQSWGGYQVAYIVTQTNLFKAAWAGAPVTNMTSAYGGVRWESGMSRMFQYEQTQSRIGATLWEKPELYIENSPLFHAPKVATPLVIVHNDRDGAVPWYQGIEFFLALRRLSKPVWMLNYNREPHNLKKNSPNGKDLSIRFQQFFDHYLKGKPMPVWLKDGIPALKKGKDLGYSTE